MTPQAVTLSRLTRAIAGYLSRPELTNVWVVAELMDLRVNHGHCYMELVEKDPDSGTVLARMRAAIWASNYGRISAAFMAATGQRLESGMKVLLCGSVNFHSSYGLSLVISNIDPSYTLGEAERRRREILQRLQSEGIINDNRSLPWPDPALRIAVISAPGAAGYGDFINQLYNNGSNLRFTTGLFTAVLQGDRTSPTVIAALEQIAAEADNWDCVVIIRGGGATSDLQAFDDYALASNVAQFPLPVIVGIGHERDVTVLDYVANRRVKTPTAAAEYLIACGEANLERLRQLASDILRCASDRVASSRTQLAQLASMLDIAPRAFIDRSRNRLQQATTSLATVGARRVAPELARLTHYVNALSQATSNVITRASDRLTAADRLLQALSPQATLNRGFSLTTYRGTVLRDAASLPEGAVVTTRLAKGAFESTVNGSTAQKS